MMREENVNAFVRRLKDYAHGGLFMLQANGWVHVSRPDDPGLDLWMEPTPPGSGRVYTRAQALEIVSVPEGLKRVKNNS